eukprot:m.168569 g.168569  ORF g.168569 m.168569 type:complete len:117 (+) comp53211_c0_seq1:78-428(+)
MCLCSAPKREDIVSRYAQSAPAVQMQPQMIVITSQPAFLPYPPQHPGPGGYVHQQALPPTYAQTMRPQQQAPDTSSSWADTYPSADTPESPPTGGSDTTGGADAGASSNDSAGGSD